MTFRQVVATQIRTSVQSKRSGWRGWCQPVGLGLVVFCSTLPYVGGLGFYSDDWGFLAAMHENPQGSFVGVTKALVADNIDLKVRPAQTILLAALYRSFGLQPLGYHVVNAILLATAVLLLYAVFRELQTADLVALGVPLIWGMLPHYSTDRFWVAAFQANLSMVFCFLSYLAALRAATEGRCRLSWLLISVLSAAVSLASYEISLGLLAILPFVILFRARLQRGFRRGVAKGSLPATVLMIAIGVMFVLKWRVQQRIAYHGHLLQHIGGLARHCASQFLEFNFGRYSIGYPRVLFRSQEFLHSSLWACCAIALGAGISAVLYLSLRKSEFQLPTAKQAVMLLGSGTVVFGVGYALFFADIHVDLHTTGTNNRVAIAAAVGTAMMWVAVAVLLAKLPQRLSASHAVFSFVIALLCASGFLSIAGLGTAWTQAYRKQQLVIVDLQHAASVLPSGSTVLLDGICPYVGPGVVFEAAWDVTGMLNILYADSSLRGDIVTSRTALGIQDVETEIYGSTTVYPFDKELFVFNFAAKRLTPLSNAADAKRYFATERVSRSSCPDSRAGNGAAIF
jgi:hypothetical protein